MITPPVPVEEPQRLEALYRLDMLDSEPEERFDRVTRIARRLFDVPIALVSLVDMRRQWFKSRAGLDALETSRDISFCAHAILQDRILLVSDALQDERFCDNPQVTGPPFVRFYAGCPLHSPDGYRIGTLCLVDTRPRTLDATELELLSDLGRVIEAELNASSMASTDKLTGISNRHGFEQLARQSLKLCERHHWPVQLLYFDLNDFKRINDTYGHDAGDETLRYFARLLHNSVRDSDTVARLGGDEFVLLMPDATEQGWQLVIKRLEEGLRIFNQQHPGWMAKASCGRAQSEPGEPLSLEGLLEQADAAMYRVKRLRQPDQILAF